MKRAIIAAALVLAACGPSKPVISPTAAGPPNAPKVVPGTLEATPLLGDVPQRAAKLGAGPLSIVVSGPLNEGERLGAFVEIPPDVCLLAYARAAPSVEDIDLA